MPWQARAQAQALDAVQATAARAQAQRQPEVDARAQALLLQPDPGVGAPGADAAMQSALSLALAARRPERAEERGFAWTAGPQAQDVGAALAAAPMASASGADPAVSAALANPLTEQLMEQVSWYLSQKTQGAHLTLDMPGGAPVSVSIQVQGNEAQVAFRSDQPEARQLLTQSLPHLKDLLGAEGLMLSGASVGAGQGRQEERAPDGSPRRPGAAFGSAAGDKALPLPREVAVGRLDLYV